MNLKSPTLPVWLALATLLVSADAVAGPPKGDGPGWHGAHSAEKHLARLDEALDLSDEQSAEVLIVLQAAEEERRALHKRVMEQIKPEMCAQMEATHTEILAILTPEQAEDFEEMVAERKGRFHERGRRGGLGDFDCGDPAG